MRRDERLVERSGEKLFFFFSLFIYLLFIIILTIFIIIFICLFVYLFFGLLRCLLTIFAARKWFTHQFDVQNVFLHGNLDEEVYMSLPPGIRR